jgi:hypothetical protein
VSIGAFAMFGYTKIRGMLGVSSVDRRAAGIRRGTKLADGGADGIGGSRGGFVPKTGPATDEVLLRERALVV